MKVRIAVTPTAATQGGDEFGAYLQHAEQLGFDTLWLSDVPLSATGDPLLSLAFAAGVTRKLKLGANVVPLGRNPALLAQMWRRREKVRQNESRAGRGTRNRIERFVCLRSKACAATGKVQRMTLHQSGQRAGNEAEY